MKILIDKAERAAKKSVSVLITGPTGTGKEVLAKAIHRMGPRSDKAYIAINCAAIPSATIESELFGHEAGAFTGADKKKSGLMEIADNGILFLDEISLMSEQMQGKLLRALEERSFRRMGGTAEIKVDVQVIAASNRDLDKMMEEGKFGPDLFFRLKVVDLKMPSLKERKEDIPELIAFFIKQLNAEMGLNINDISAPAMDALMNAPWPGNIRELRNTIESAMLFCDEATLDVAHFPEELFTKKKAKPKNKKK